MPSADDDPDERDEDHRRAISDVRIRERRRALKEVWGTSDLDEIEKLKRKQSEDSANRAREQEELQALRSKEQERERSQMTETQRLQADLDAANARVKQLEGEIATARQEVLTERQNGAVRAAAIRHRLKAKASVLRVVLAEFGAHYLSLTAVEKRQFANPANAERQLDRWMSRFAKENPEMCEAAPRPAAETEQQGNQQQQAAPPPRQPAPAVRRPIGAPRQPQQPQQRMPAGQRPPGTNSQGKVVKPGLPNSMNAQELAAYKRDQGLKA